MSFGGSKGSQNQNSQFSGNSSTTPIAPKGFEDIWNSITGMNGATPGQTQASDFFKNQLTAPSSNANQVMDYANWFANKANNTPGPAQVTAPGATASHGYDTMDKYTNPYTNQVVDAATADLSHQRDLNQNASNMAGTAAGGFANSRMGLRDAQVQNDFNRTLASTDAGLRSAGFNTALGAGQNDANMATNVSVGNADRNLNAQQFNVGSAFQQNQNSMDAASKALASVLGHNDIQTADATNLSNAGGINFSQLLQGLGAGTPLFGSTSNTKGQSQGSGSSSQKGGGVSLF